MSTFIPKFSFDALAFTFYHKKKERKTERKKESKVPSYYFLLIHVKLFVNLKSFNIL